MLRSRWRQSIPSDGEVHRGLRESRRDHESLSRYWPEIGVGRLPGFAAFAHGKLVALAGELPT